MFSEDRWSEPWRLSQEHGERPRSVSAWKKEGRDMFFSWNSVIVRFAKGTFCVVLESPEPIRHFWVVPMSSCTTWFVLLRNTEKSLGLWYSGSRNGKATYLESWPNVQRCFQLETEEESLMFQKADDVFQFIKYDFRTSRQEIFTSRRIPGAHSWKFLANNRFLTVNNNSGEISIDGKDFFRCLGIQGRND